MLAIYYLTILLFSFHVSTEYSSINSNGEFILLNGLPGVLKGTNYYPRTAMWGSMWENWPWDEIKSEVSLLKSIGINAFRILVPYSQGGWNGPNIPAERLNQLWTLVDYLGNNSINSLITLFDWETTWPAAGTALEANHLKYVHTIIDAFRGNPYVILWDIKNEPDHPNNINGHDNWNDVPQQRDIIVSWLTRMSNAIRANDTQHPVSIGIRWWQNFATVVNIVKVAMFHSYWDPNVEIPVIQQAIAKSPMPIIVEEFGWPTAPVGPQYNESVQLDFYQSQISVYKKYNVNGYFQWMSFDAKPYDGSSDENFFGLFRFDQTLKPD